MAEADCNEELEQERSSNALPMLAIGADETPAWMAERMCPECGEGPLELQWSTPPILGFISHCGGSWLRAIKGHKGSEQPA